MHFYYLILSSKLIFLSLTWSPTSASPAFTSCFDAPVVFALDAVSTVVVAADATAANASVSAALLLQLHLMYATLYCC